MTPRSEPGWSQPWIQWIVQSVRAAGWAPVVVVLAHLSISRGTRGYAEIPSLDIWVHFLGGVAIGYFFYCAVRNESGARVLGQLTEAGEALLAWALAGTSTVAWECAEWTTDRLGFTSAQAGLPDTMLDMVMGGAGATLVILLLGRSNVISSGSRGGSIAHK